MTTYNKTTLKTFFEQNDIPTGQNYADLIDSQVNLVETALQTMAGPLSTTQLITPQVSATNANFTGGLFSVAVSNIGLGAANSIAVSAVNNITVSAGNGFSINSGTSVNLNNNTGDSISLATGINLNSSNNILVSAAGGAITLNGTNNALNINGFGVNINPTTSKTSLSGVTSAAQILNSVAIISAAGTTQGAAASLTGTINRGKGIVDGSTTGFTPLANKAGLVQYLYNEGPSANLWPPTGGTINGLAANAVFPLAASAMVTIVHLTASAYAVK